MVYEITLDGLLRLSKSYYVKDKANFLVIKVQVEGSAPEIIINPKENFEAKLAYYASAYNEDLTLKTNPNIRIVGYDFLE